MATIDLAFGSGSIPFAFDDQRFQVLQNEREARALTDVELGERLDSPIDSATIEEIVSRGETVLFVVPDATRRVGAGQIINLLVRRLIANGTEPNEMSVIFATGIHRPVTDSERNEILTPFIAQRLKTLHHGSRDLMQIVRVGETSGGIPVELNRTLFDFDHVVPIGGVSFHYFAGFTGGRKLICPGLASAKTIAATHKLAFDCEKLTRRDGVGTGLLNGNAVHEAFVEAASLAKIAFSATSIVNENGDVAELFCGDWISSHRVACERFAEANTISIPEKRELVIVGCGGYPHDINMIQAHKSLEAASHACSDGGTIVLVAECRDGLGRDDFLQWFESKNSGELAAKLCESYKVNGQTAWTLMEKTERFRVQMVTSLDDETLRKMRIDRSTDLNGNEGNGYIIPNGSKLRLISSS